MRSEHALEGVRRGRPSHSMEMRSGVIRCLIRLGRDTCSDLVSEVNKQALHPQGFPLSRQARESHRYSTGDVEPEQPKSERQMTSTTTYDVEARPPNTTQEPQLVGWGRFERGLLVFSDLLSTLGELGSASHRGVEP